jgi:ADP-ribosylglycohydrolase
MVINFETYKDKVMGCWAGKNIGGVLGAPFEGKRQWNDVDFYIQDLSNGPPPNDDLDLQIVWLAAVERYGRQVDASVLAEYWLSYVTPFWAEYGIGKSNLVNGLPPPLSGHVLNRYKDSCGCFIRSEIWACLAPGHPDLAARYAYEDAIVDHSGDGMYGEIFCAALESAAFVESDIKKLIEIGLSYIPPESAVARCVKKAIECYNQKIDLKEARRHIHNEAPGTFGMISQRCVPATAENEGLETGTPGCDCPENIGFLIAGWLYGEGDFGKSLCMAAACGEDTDCTAATLGAIMGIVCGASGIPDKWVAPLDDKIATLCINLTSWGGVWVPKTVTELTDRVLRVTPIFLGVDNCDLFAEGGYSVNCSDDLYCPGDDGIPGHLSGERPRGLSVKELVSLSPFITRHSFTTHTVLADYCGDIYYRRDKPKKIKITVINNNTMLQQMWCRVKMHVPEGARLTGAEEFPLQLNTLHGDRGEVVFEIDASEFKSGTLDLLIDISFPGRHTSSVVKAALFSNSECN